MVTGLGCLLIVSHQDHTPEWIQDFANPYTQYAIHNCAEEAELIYHSIIRSSADRPDLDSASHKATGLIEEFNQFMAQRDPEYQPITVPDDLLTKSLTQRMEDPGSYLFDYHDWYAAVSVCIAVCPMLLCIFVSLVDILMPTTSVILARFSI